VKAIWQLFAAECNCFQTIQHSFRDELATVVLVKRPLLEEMANILGCNVPAASTQGSSPQTQTPQRKKRPGVIKRS